MDLNARFRVFAIAVIVAGVALAGVGFIYGVPTAEDGLSSAQAMYEDQGVTLSYNEDGQLIDRGDPELAQTIMGLLADDWAYPVNMDNFDPDDPLVNTRDELMYQYAVIIYHVKHGEADVVLTQDHLNASGGAIEYRGVTYDEPGTYQIEVGKYYAELDRRHPIEGQLRAQWSPLALSLTSYLAAGHANQAAGELAQATSFGFGAVGVIFVAVGGGMFWVAAGRRD